jgi:hypothetical protein
LPAITRRDRDVPVTSAIRLPSERASFGQLGAHDAGFFYPARRNTETRE